MTIFDRERARRTEADIGEIMTEVAALLRAGSHPPQAWTQVLAQQPANSVWSEAATEIAAGIPVPDALEKLAKKVQFPGPLLGAAASSRLAHELGSSAAEVLDQCVETVTHLQDSAAQRRSALAGPKATMRVLLWLPFIALTLFFGAGIDTWGALFGGPLGWMCLVLGAIFLTLGARWVRRLIITAERGVTP